MARLRVHHDTCGETIIVDLPDDHPLDTGVALHCPRCGDVFFHTPQASEIEKRIERRQVPLFGDPSWEGQDRRRNPAAPPRRRDAEQPPAADPPAAADGSPDQFVRPAVPNAARHATGSVHDVQLGRARDLIVSDAQRRQRPVPASHRRSDRAADEYVPPELRTASDRGAARWVIPLVAVAFLVVIGVWFAIQGSPKKSPDSRSSLDRTEGVRTIAAPPPLPTAEPAKGAAQSRAPVPDRPVPALATVDPDDEVPVPKATPVAPIENLPAPKVTLSYQRVKADGFSMLVPTDFRVTRSTNYFGMSIGPQARIGVGVVSARTGAKLDILSEDARAQLAGDVPKAAITTKPFRLGKLTAQRLTARSPDGVRVEYIVATAKGVAHTVRVQVRPEASPEERATVEPVLRSFRPE